MSYTELNEHPDKFNLMNTAFTLQRAEIAFKQIMKADSESKAKLT